MQVPFRGTLTRDDYLRAVSLHRRMPEFVRITLWALLGLVLFAIVIAILIALALLPRHLFFRPRWYAYALICAVLVIVGSWLLSRYQTLRYWNGNRSLQSPMSGTVMPDEGIQILCAGAEGRFSWAAYGKQKRSPDMILLYTSEIVFHIFPKSFFETEDDWQVFIELVRINISS